MLRTIKIDLPDFKVEPFQVDVNSPFECINMLRSRFPGLTAKYPNLTIAVFAEYSEKPVSVNQWNTPFTEDEKLIGIMFVPEGEGWETLAAIVAGWGATGTMAVVLTAVLYVGVSFAMSFLFGAISSALAPRSDISGQKRESEDTRPSFLLGQIQNVKQEGGPIPKVYGEEVFIGSTIVSIGSSSEEIYT